MGVSKKFPKLQSASPPRMELRNRGTGASSIKMTLKRERTTTARTSDCSAAVDDDERSRPKKTRRRTVEKTVPVAEDIKMEPPPHWEEMYSLTREMRSKILAPVDMMGCEQLADQKATPHDQRFQVLVSLMLSSQTKDTVTAAAIANLQEHLPGGLTLQSTLAACPTKFNELIGKVGFHNTKTKHIQQTAAVLVEKFGSDIPDTIDGLVSLPGVGPKMAYLCMSAAWGRDLGIGVDVHVHRITNLWGWHSTKNPEQTRKMLEAWLPRDRWHDINHLLVGFGQTICLPVGRKCGECLLATRGLCPAAFTGKKGVTKVKREINVSLHDVVVKQEVDVVEGQILTENALGDIEDIASLAPTRRLRKSS